MKLVCTLEVWWQNVSQHGFKQCFTLPKSMTTKSPQLSGHYCNTKFQYINNVITDFDNYIWKLNVEYTSWLGTSLWYHSLSPHHWYISTRQSPISNNFLAAQASFAPVRIAFHVWFHPTITVTQMGCWVLCMWTLYDRVAHYRNITVAPAWYPHNSLPTMEKVWSFISDLHTINVWHGKEHEYRKSNPTPISSCNSNFNLFSMKYITGTKFCPCHNSRVVMHSRICK